MSRKKRNFVIGTLIAAPLITGGVLYANRDYCREREGQTRCARNLEFKNYDTVFFGEQHGEGLLGFTTCLYERDDLYLAVLLPELHEDGFNYLALELPAKEQEAFDSYAAGDLSREQFTEQVLKNYKVPDDAYLDLIDTALNLGMKVIAIDGNKDSEGNEAESQEEREDRTEQNLAALLEINPNAKLVFLYGLAHASEDEQNWSCGSRYLPECFTPLGYRLENHFGLDTLSVSLAGRKGGISVDYIISLKSWGGCDAY